MVSFKAGDQSPVIPFKDDVGKAVKELSEQKAATGVNVGVTVGLIVIDMVVLVPHCPAFGVNVYVVLAVLLKAGDQFPAIPFVEVDGKTDRVVPEQSGATAVNVVVTIGFTVITIVLLVAHCPTVGVNV